jgi:hypothetical protein
VSRAREVLEARKAHVREGQLERRIADLELAYKWLFERYQALEVALDGSGLPHHKPRS